MTAVWCDGRVIAAGELPPAVGVAPFETMGATAGEMPLWDLHLARLGAAAARLGLSFAEPIGLRAAAGTLLRQNGHADDVLRLALRRAADGAVHVVLATRARGPALRCVRLLPTVVARTDDDPPGDLKAEPRRFYDAVRQQAQDGGADDGIVIAADGAVLETAVANLWLRLAGTWVTPPLDGRVLPGVARALLLAAARTRGVPVAERAVDLGHLHAAEALAVSSAVHGPRAAVLLAVKGGLDPTAVAAIVDRELRPLWRSGAAD
jgi:branched-subunit amino acid aminotransferase/4-amino-4-deoxychorismate lyase